jgi:hypothetical protein
MEVIKNLEKKHMISIVLSKMMFIQYVKQKKEKVKKMSKRMKEQNEGEREQKENIAIGYGRKERSFSPI